MSSSRLPGMDLTLPYEVTSDQDVAAMFVIPVTDTVDNPKDCEDYQSDTGSLQQDNTMETDQDHPEEDEESSCNSSNTDNFSQNSPKVDVLNSEPRNEAGDEDSGAFIGNRTNPKIDTAESGQSDNGNSTCNSQQQATVKFKTIRDKCSRSEDQLQCPKCKQLFEIDTDLTQHTCSPLKESQGALSCAICQTTFENMEKLKEHMKKHWDRLPYKCHICSERYWTEKSLKRHLIKHESRDKPFACVECKAKYVHKRQLLLHMANVHSRDKTARKHPCELCGRNFLRRCDLTKHVKKCVDAEELLDRENNLEDSDSKEKNQEEANMTTRSNEKLETENMEILTSNCEKEKVEPEVEATGSNEDTKDSKRQENILTPGAAFSPLQLMNILSSIQGSGIPAIVPFINMNTLAQSVVTSPLLSMLPLLPVASLLAQNSLPAVSSLPTEEKSTMDSSSDDKVQSTSEAVKVQSRRKIKQPRKTISKMLHELPNNRPEMGEKVIDVVEIIRRNQALASAVADQVKDQKEGALYNCQVCAKSFPTLTELQVHCANHGSTVFSCKYCKKVLSSQVSLYRHEADHEDNRPFKCESCDKAFVLKAELNRHTEIQHSKRPFTCKVCRFNFSCQANLTAHMPVHLEKRACPLCPRSFTTETYLQRHLARHHDIVDPDALI